MAEETGVMSAEYLVFARKDYAEPLRHLGQLSMEGHSVSDFIQSQGGEWLEIVLVPVKSVRWVVRPAIEEEAHA